MQHAQMIPATQQFEQLQKQLLEAYVQREAADEKIKAIRNVIAGVGLGVEIQKEAASPDPTAK